MVSSLFPPSTQSTHLILRPNQPTSLVLLDILALCKRLPQVDEKVCALLNVLVAEKGRDGPSGFFAVVEGDAAVITSVRIFDDKSRVDGDGELVWIGKW
jgi:hypothetical protein